MTVKMTASLPDHGRNGLEAVAQQLLDQPADLHVVIALVDCKKTTTDYDTGEVTPTARIRRIEVVQDEADGRRLMTLLRRAWETRTGKTVLSLDLEDELRGVFGEEDNA